MIATIDVFTLEQLEERYGKDNKFYRRADRLQWRPTCLFNKLGQRVPTWLLTY